MLQRQQLLEIKNEMKNTLMNYLSDISCRAKLDVKLISSWNHEGRCQKTLKK